MAKAARGRLKVAARCGSTTVSRRVKPKRGRWKTTLTMRGKCARARRAMESVRYPGGAKHKSAAAARRARKRG